LKGDVVLSLPEGLTAAKGAVILYVQNTKSLKITGATQATIH
jgi:hypothetical protein